MTIEQVAASGYGLTTLTDVRTQAPSLRVIDCNLLNETVAALMAAVKARQPKICRIGVRSHELH